MNIEKFFLDLRFNEKHHLGLGDIRLTLGQQDEIIAEFKNIEMTVRRAFYKLSKGMNVSQQDMASLKIIAERNAKPLR